MEKKSFKETLNLPKTEFPIRSNPKVDDPAMIDRWKKDDLYTKAFYQHKGEKGSRFILVDGPPYANGPIHLGHAYNKILKDIVAKSQRMQKKQVPVIPGWDCHGLPIEIKVVQENQNLSPSQLKKKCRDYANKWINVQREEFKRIGVIMDWDRPYVTMDFSYEADILRAFALSVGKGYIKRTNKTVPWCFSCKTVLASAEIEYKERKDPSIYVLFPFKQDVTDILFPSLKSKKVSLVVWTTTPWTLPLNRAILLKPHTPYVVLEINDQYVLIGKTRADALCALLGVDKHIVAECTAEEIHAHNNPLQHPFIDRTVPIILDQSVELSEGTASVHSAPGAGPIDYEIGIKNDLEIYSPVGPDGSYTDEIEPHEWAGTVVSDAQGLVIKTLASKGHLLHKTSIRHSYPHCWRCHGGLIFRATKQWFFDLAHQDLKPRVLDAVQTVKTIPEKSINRLHATVEGRWEWCISRQRIWGTPIPALICVECDEAYITEKFVNTIAENVEKEGSEFWEKVPLESIMPKDISCYSCGNNTFKKEGDILDVWFDAGVSHFAVLQKNPDQSFPADLYLEGSDQHRGYFQSSLITSVALDNRACMKSILTHGFIVDEKGHKMSKSIGNVVTPQEIMDKIGTDGLRLWVASADYASGDSVLSAKTIENVSAVLRKIRNTCRFLLSNLYDFDSKKDSIAFENLRTIDRYALCELYAINQQIQKLYREYDFTAIFHKIGDYCAVNLSTFYLDIIKDRLYVEQADGKLRRSAQTVCFYILDTLTKLIAPICSFMAEQISDLYQKDKSESIHLQLFTLLEEIRLLYEDQKELNPVFNFLKTIRSSLLKAIENEREKGLVKHSLEAKIIIYFDPSASYYPLLNNLMMQLKDNGEHVQDFLKELLVISQCVLAESSNNLEQSTLEGLYVTVHRAEGVKCPRCWQWNLTERADFLCDRCSSILFF